MLHIRRAEIPIFSIVQSNALGKSELRLAWAALLKVAVVAKGCTFSPPMVFAILGSSYTHLWDAAPSVLSPCRTQCGLG